MRQVHQKTAQTTGKAVADLQFPPLDGDIDQCACWMLAWMDSCHLSQSWWSSDTDMENVWKSVASNGLVGKMIYKWFVFRIYGSLQQPKNKIEHCLGRHKYKNGTKLQQCSARIKWYENNMRNECKLKPCLSFWDFVNPLPNTLSQGRLCTGSKPWGTRCTLGKSYKVCWMENQRTSFIDSGKSYVDDGKWCISCIDDLWWSTCSRNGGVLLLQWECATNINEKRRIMINRLTKKILENPTKGGRWCTIHGKLSEYVCKS